MCCATTRPRTSSSGRASSSGWPVSRCIPSTRPTASPALKHEAGIGYCNINKCCTDVCPEHIRITDNAIIPLKERVADEYYDPLRMLWRRLRGQPDRSGGPSERSLPARRRPAAAPEPGRGAAATSRRRARDASPLIRTDGAARDNPGPASAGAVLIDAERPDADDPDAPPLSIVARPLGIQTNNVAEYTALLLALREAHRLGATEIDLRLDSKLIVEQLHGRWRVKDVKLKPLHGEARQLLGGLRTLGGAPRAPRHEPRRRRARQPGPRRPGRRRRPGGSLSGAQLRSRGERRAGGARFGKPARRPDGRAQAG